MSKDCIKRFETKNFRSSCHKRSAYYTGTAYIFVCILNRKTHKSSGFNLPIDALKDVKKLKTHNALLRLIKSNKTPLCPCPPETAKPALVAVDGGILSIAKRLKEIKEEINLLNGSAFQNSTLTDAQHYQLLDIEMFIADFIAPYSYREVVK